MPNLVPQEIKNAKQRPTFENRNFINDEDIKQKSIFERQLNAAKSLANILNIIKQTTANINVGKEEVQERTKIYNSKIKQEKIAE